MIELNDQDILSRLKNTEDSTVERKTANDYRDCLKTAVAFSNSLPVDDPGIIFVGVFDNGRPQGGQNFDSLQKQVSKELNKIYPPIEPQMLVRKDENGTEFLAVIVRGSPNRPHFGGQSYIRDGSKTEVASEQQFEQLIAERNSKLRYISRWRGKEISYRYMDQMAPARQGCLTDCNQFFVVIDDRISTPLDWVQIAHGGGNDKLRLLFIKSDHS